MVRLAVAVLAVAAAAGKLGSALYIPGIAPHNYVAGDVVPLTVNALLPELTSSHPQLASTIGYNYYHPQLHFCSEDKPKSQSESIGSILFGDRIMSSPFRLKLLQNETCQVLCSVNVPGEDGKFIKDLISESYMVNWLIDGLPVASPVAGESTYYSAGFPLGYYDSEKKQSFVNNYYSIIVEYHPISATQYRIVGASVVASSVDVSMTVEGDTSCNGGSSVALSGDDQETRYKYAYSVTWVKSNKVWATRWDKYLYVYDQRIHWFALINATLIVSFLTFMVGGILYRALHNDISRYNANDLDQEDVQEDSGWKLIYGDVFRPPKHRLLLSVFVGSGVQIFCMTGATLVFALFGFLSPSNRGSLATAGLMFYLFLGTPSGYVSARVYKSIGGEEWKKNVVLTPTFVPGIVFGTFFLLNLFLVAARSSGAVPFTTMLVIVGLWFLISLPLSFIGSYLGFRAPAFESPVRTNQIPRQVPDQVFYLRDVPSILFAGILPFGAIFVELYFIMNSIWFSRIYYMFGFLFLCFGIMIVTCATVTILMAYFQLCAENYHWWWRSFFTSGACAFYIFLHSIVYWIMKMKLGSFSSSILYLGYSMLISFLAFILLGTIGFMSTYFFVHKIYRSLKVD